MGNSPDGGWPGAGDDAVPGAGDDVVEMGGGRRWPSFRWRPRPAMAVIAAAALGLGFAVGYSAGARHARPAAAPPAPSRAAGPAPASALAAPFSAGGFPLSQSGPQCTVQAGRELQVGLQITNVSSVAVQLRRVQVILPRGGLRVTARAWAPCGQLPVIAAGPGHDVPPSLGPGASAWFTVTFQVLVNCPKPLPVQFALDYDQHGGTATIRLPGFPDLGQVPYSGCP
jgi:hypothetical protein